MRTLLSMEAFLFYGFLDLFSLFGFADTVLDIVFVLLISLFLDLPTGFFDKLLACFPLEQPPKQAKIDCIVEILLNRFVAL